MNSMWRNCCVDLEYANILILNSFTVQQLSSAKGCCVKFTGSVHCYTYNVVNAKLNNQRLLVFPLSLFSSLSLSSLVCLSWKHASILSCSRCSLLLPGPVFPSAGREGGETHVWYMTIGVTWSRPLQRRCSLTRPGGWPGILLPFQMSCQGSTLGECSSHWVYCSLIY